VTGSATESSPRSSWHYLLGVAVVGSVAAWVNFKFILRGAGVLTDEAWMAVVTRRLLAGLVAEALGLADDFALAMSGNMGRTGRHR
jgi:hypothetical protein